MSSVLLQGHRLVPAAELVESLRMVVGLRVCGNRGRGCLVSGNVGQRHYCKHDPSSRVRCSKRFQEDALLASEWDTQEDAPPKAQSDADAVVVLVECAGGAQSYMGPADAGSDFSAGDTLLQPPNETASAAAPPTCRSPRTQKKYLDLDF
jgi:hypothetical protein